MKSTVLVVFGGDSWEREGSITSAATVAHCLDRNGITNRLVEFPLKDSDIGISQDVIVFNCMHGKNGEDGALSAFCESRGLAYNFSRPYPHMVGFDKLKFKSLAHSIGVKTASVLDCLEASRTSIPLPMVTRDQNKRFLLKPNFGGGSRGLRIVMPSEDLAAAIAERDQQYEPYFVEEFIEGTFVTSVVVGEPSIDEEFPLLEVRFNGDLYNYEMKHHIEEPQFVVPAEIPEDATSRIFDWSQKLYKAVGCEAAVRFDYLVSADGTPFLLEANTVPGLSEGGNLSTVWKATGRTYDDLVLFLLKQACVR